MRPVAVFDTNILFSGTGWKGKPHECLELARSGAIEGVTCQELLDELLVTLHDKLSLDLKQAAETVLDLGTFLRWVSITGQLKVVALDPDDDKVLECAVVASATHIVTGDRRHLLPLRSFQGIPILSAAEFLEVVKAWPSRDQGLALS